MVSFVQLIIFFVGCNMQIALAKIDSAEEKHYEILSPFELKNELIKLARENPAKNGAGFLNAGRGDPNWVATTPRQAFSQFNLFAIEESSRTIEDLPNLGGIPDKTAIAKRFDEYLSRHSNEPGIDFLRNVFNYAYSELHFNADDFVGEMVDAVLGDRYPEPDRILPHIEKIVRQYLGQEMCGSKDAFDKIDLFATEGGTAAITNILTSLIANKLLHRGDKIAIGTPIFTPYLEIPHLKEFEFIKINIKQDRNKNWQYPDSEIEKLMDPDIKAFFLVNPSNPTAVSMQQETLNKLAALVKTKRKDLILLTDDVYGTFVNDFRSLIDVAPANTLFVYSFSKYFGASGLRLGVIGLHKNNVLDEMIANFSSDKKLELRKRYEFTVPNPDKMKLIDRMVADSRLVAMNHTAGLSTSQQVSMALFSLMSLIDRDDKYKKALQVIVKDRFYALYDAIGIGYPENKYSTYYYTIIDIIALAQTRYSKEFSQYLANNLGPISFLMRLAKDKSVVLLDGRGFDAPTMSVRVSLANLSCEQYKIIGKEINNLLADYYREWQVSCKDL